MTKIYARPIAVATLTLALALGGCQTVSDLDPTGLLGGGDDGVADSQFPPESDQQAVADAATTTPDLAAIPARPSAPNTAAQASATQQVAAAGAQAQYSADALRAGTDAAAPPPTASADTSATRQALASADAPPTASADAPPSAGADAPPTAGDAPPSASAPSRAASGNAAVPAAPQRVASAAPPPSAPVSSAPVASAPVAAPSAAPVASAAMTTPPGAEPAVPAVPRTAGSRMAMANPSDSQLGFKQSTAPALNPGVANWVAPPIMARYRQTAAMAGTAGTGAPAVPAVAGKGVGGPMMSGNVVANLDAIPGTAAGMVAANNGGVPPAAIIYFTGDGTSLTRAALTEVRNAAAAFKATGGTGSVKVVGHASSRTPNMPVERHLEVIFQKSQARANAVAQALIKAGVPAAQVQIEAVGDSQPVFYESMPKGEDGNRRAEIFVQS